MKQNKSTVLIVIINFWLAGNEMWAVPPKDLVSVQPVRNKVIDTTAMIMSPNIATFT